MPTTLPRIQVTLTSDVQQALLLAEEVWPGAAKSELVTHLVLRGSEALAVQADRARIARRCAIRDSLGSVKGAYPTDYVEELRQDWPT